MRASSLGGSIVLAVAERDFHVGKGQRAVLRRHEVFAVQAQQQVEHVLVEHVPGPDLLLDHVEAGAFEIQLWRSWELMRSVQSSWVKRLVERNSQGLTIALARFRLAIIP